MAVKIYPDYDSLSLHAATEIAAQIADKPNSVLCLTAGDTPRMVYKLLTDIVRKENIDCSKCTFIGLDEWVGVPPENEGSCHYFLSENLLKPLSVAPGQSCLFNGMAKDLAAECNRVDSFIRDRGGIDLMLVGVGMNGHVGFNEPRVAEDRYAHVVELHEMTRSVGQKYFKEAATLPQQGITLGLRHVLESRKVILIASGMKKARIVSQALQSDISTEIPASIIRKHASGVTMLDEDAAARLTII